ncbi:MAG: acetyltransferase [Planctomycetota bacterium]
MSQQVDLIIVGAGGFAREMHGLLPSFNLGPHVRFRGYLAQDTGVAARTDVSDQILASPEDYQPQAHDRFVLAIGNMPARQRVVDALQQKAGRFLTLVHPLAMVADSAQLDEGVIVYPFAAVSNGAHLGEFTKLNYYASAGHDSVTGRCCLLAPYATINGFARLADYVYLSTHSTVAPQVQVGSQSILSANSAAMHDVPEHSFVFGVPGRVTRRM